VTREVSCRSAASDHRRCAARTAGGPDEPLLACGTLLLERKLVHACGCCGHVEDVVVDSAARGRGVGKLLLSSLVDVARSHGCYKARLNDAQSLMQSAPTPPLTPGPLVPGRRSSWTARPITLPSTSSAALLKRSSRCAWTYEPQQMDL